MAVNAFGLESHPDLGLAYALAVQFHYLSLNWTPESGSNRVARADQEEL